MLARMGREIQLSEVTGKKDSLPFIDLVRILRTDIKYLSKGKYDFEDIVYVLQKNREDEGYCKRYLNEVMEDIYEDIACEYRGNLDKTSRYVGYLKTIQQDFNRLYGFVNGEKYILEVPSENIFDALDFSGSFDELFLNDCKYMSLCFQLKDGFSNIIAEIGETGLTCSVEFGEKAYEGEPLYRLNITALTQYGMVILGEYEFIKKEKEILFVSSKSGCQFCRKDCKQKETIKVKCETQEKYVQMRYEYENYCSIKKGTDDKVCIPNSINPFQILEAMAYVFKGSHNRELIVREKSEQKRKIGKMIISDDFMEYHIIPISKNYIYLNSETQETSGTHKSPVTHTRRGTPLIINKYGTAYSRKGTIVNKDHKTEKVIYKL